MQTSAAAAVGTALVIGFSCSTRNGLLDKHFYHQPEAEAEAVAGGARAGLIKVIIGLLCVMRAK
jgi:hypothetical protein